jgi:hypothetical protein
LRYDPKQATQPGGNPGTYNFEVATATEERSKGGNEMMKLILKVDVGGNALSVYDYLVNTPGGLWKAKMFCKEVGLDFDSGCLNVENCIGKGGVVVLDYDKKDLEKVNAGEQGKAYLKVMRYGIHKDKPAAGTPPAAQAAPSAQQQAMTGEDNIDVPF